MSPLRALAATTGTSVYPFLAAFESAAGVVENIAPAFGQRYQAPTPNNATMGSHSHRRPEGRALGGWAGADGVRSSACSTVGEVSFFMSLTAWFPRATSSKAIVVLRGHE